MNNYEKIAMNDIIFEGRNKQYGAYVLRQNISKNSSIGLMITISVFTVILIIYTYNPFRKTISVGDKTEVWIQTQDITIPPQPIIKPEVQQAALPPKVNMVKDVEMKVVTDNAATAEAPITREVAAVSNTGIANVTDGVDRANTIANVETTNTSNTNVSEAINTETVIKTEMTSKILQTAAEMPSFYGGKDALMEYLRNNIKPYSSDVERGVSGKVILRFYIDTDGTVKNVEVLKDYVGGRCAEAAINAVKKMPKWKAGRQNDVAVKVYFTLPVSFDFSRN